MAEVIWTQPALDDLDAVADYIALDDREAAKALVRRIFDHVGQLSAHPKSGSIPKDLRPIRTYRQIVEPPCRVFYRIEGVTVYILHVARGERLLDKRKLKRSS